MNENKQGIDSNYEQALADEQINFSEPNARKLKGIKGAVARGWGYPENAEKIMDVDLANAISLEVEKLFKDFKEPQLGCATTRELLAEIKARIEVDGNLDYRTVDVQTP